MRDRETWFVVAAVAMLVVVLAAAAVAATDAGSDGTDATIDEWTPDVEDVRDVDPPDDEGVATVDDREFDSVQAAVDAANEGDTVVLEGRFDEHVTIDTPGVTLEATGEHDALIDGGGEGTVVRVVADDVTLEGLWIRESGHERSDEDAAVLVNGSATTLTDLWLTETTFGVWIGEAENVTVADSTIAGREDVPEPERGNGIHLDRADGAELRDNRITTVRDGIYFSWSDGVDAADNVLWELRYGVHYMYSDDNRLEGNVAFDNDVGFALMVSENLTITNNTAVANDGPSGQGILIKEVDDTEVRDNAVVANRNGFYVHNAHGNAIAANLVLENEVGVSFTAGSSDERVVGNTFVANDVPAAVQTDEQLAWNGSERGNYWDDARATDLDGDGTSEVRHQPVGAVENLVREQPQAAVFVESPAFDAVRMAESSFPVIESPGVVDHHPLAEPPHENWRDYYEDHDH